MMPSGVNWGWVSGRFRFLSQAQLESSFLHLGQIRPVFVEYTSRVSFITGPWYSGPSRFGSHKLDTGPSYLTIRHIAQPVGYMSACAERYKGAGIYITFVSTQNAFALCISNP